MLGVELCEPCSHVEDHPEQVEHPREENACGDESKLNSFDVLGKVSDSKQEENNSQVDEVCFHEAYHHGEEEVNVNTVDENVPPGGLD